MDLRPSEVKLESHRDLRFEGGAILAEAAILSRAAILTAAIILTGAAILTGSLQEAEEHCVLCSRSSSWGHPQRQLKQWQ